ncbi:MAG TPA: hypothetical protein PKA32_00565, partial [Candidatus Gracilibacteria bacterium]|nr:hypothetical protein [Candidatus Gracilibacteria bacterium]
VQAKIKEIDDRVRQIEVNRQTRKSMASLGEVGPNIFSYVTFLGEEKDGKIYAFNAAYDALSDDKKQEVRMAVESIIARDQAEVKAQTQKAMVELSKSTGNFDQISEVLGEKSKKYAEGLRLLAVGKHAEAVAAFEAYVGQTFSAEERELNSAALADAQEKIGLVKYSGDFYEGLKQYGAGDINAASKSLAAYVKWAEGSGDKELHKEQISQAREVLHLIGLTKVKQLDDLLEDVKYWKKKDLQDQYGKNGEKIDFRITGPEVDVIVDGIRGLKSKVQKGELIDYDEEFAKLKASVHLYLQKNAFDPKNNVIDKFSELYEGMNSTDPEVRKKTCIKFAKELRDLRGYDKAREYLDKALADEYRKAAKDVSQEKIMREMLGDKMIMDNVRKAASAYLTEFKKDNPDIPEDQLRKQAEQIVFNMWLQKRYSRELRHHMTGQGLADSTEALSLYNNWSPYEEDKDTSWYKPWNYEYMSAEEYDQFKDSAKENLALTIATLPIGFGAGAVGAQFGKVAFRSLATRLLVRTGAAGAEAAILAIEEGGVQAIRFGSQAWKALTPQMQRAIILSRVGAGALSVTVEGTLLLGGSTVAEGIITGQSTPITSANLVESIFKALAFRGIGTAGNKIFGNALKAGGSRGMKALIAMESMSGLAGTGIEAASLYAKGHGDFVDTGFVLRSLLENAITSTGMHWAHGKFEGGARKGRNKIEEAYNKKVAAEVESELGIKFNDPDSIRSAHVTPDGNMVINGKVVKGFTAEVLAALPQKTRQRIEVLTRKSKSTQTSKPSADIDGFKKKLEDMDLPKEKRQQVGQLVAKYEKAEINAKELDAAVHASFNESRKILIPDPDHPGQMKEVDLHSDYKTKNFAYSPEMTTYLNDHAKLQSDGPIIVKHGGDEIVILHAGADGKVEMYFGDVGNMGPSNEFSLRVKGGDANLVDLYLRDLAAVIKSEFVPGKDVNGPQVLDRIKNQLAKKFFGIETEAAFNALKKEYNLEGTWQDYQRNMGNAKILAGFRSDARGLQAEFLKEYPEANNSADPLRDNKNFADFVSKKIDALDKGSPPLTNVLRDNLDAFTESGALKDLLPEGLRGSNADVLTKDGLAKILKKKNRTAEEQLILYFALRRVNAHDIPPISGVDGSSIGKRFMAIRQNPGDVTLMDFQMAGVEVPSFKGRNFDHTDMKFFLDKVLEDALHKAKENKGSPDIEMVKSPFDESGNLPNPEDAAEHAKAAEDEKPTQVNEFLKLKETAAAKLAQIKAQIDKMSSQEKPSRAEVDKLLKLKAQYDKTIALMNQRKFSDPETGVDRPAKFAEDADFWLRNQKGEKIPPERQMMREFVFDIHNTGAINAQRGYAVTDGAMSALA